MHPSEENEADFYICKYKIINGKKINNFSAEINTSINLKKMISIFIIIND